MPPVRKYAGPRRPGERSAMVTKGKKRLTSNKRAKKANRGGQDVLMLKTLLPNSQRVNITFRDSINFNSMGSNAGGGGVSPCIMRFVMNDPNYNIAASSRLGNVITQSDTNDPIFVHENTNHNIESNLQPYYDEYYNAVVTRSNIVVNLRFKPNQIGVTEHLKNEGTGTAEDPFRLAVADPDKVGDGLFWGLSQKNQGTLSNENPSLWQLKREIPGVTMKRMTLSKNGVASKGITFKASYTPKRSAGIKDWKDNLEDFNFSAEDRVQKTRYFYVGCTSQQQPLAADFNLADVYVDFQINYEITFLNRKNVVGANNPLGHDRSDL